MIKRVILYFIAITAALYGLRALHHKGLLRTRGYYGKYIAAFFDSTPYDVLFLGSSRTEMHYDTRVFDSITGRNSFNLGVPGATVREAYSLLKGYLASHPAPRYIIYEMDYYGLHKKTKGLFAYNNFFPLLSNAVLRDELNKIDPRTKWFYYNPYYSWPFTGLKNISTSLHGWLGVPAKSDNWYYKGFFKEVMHPPLKYYHTVKHHAWFHVSERAYLDSLINFTRTHHIKLTLMTSPLFAGGHLEIDNRDQIITQVRHIASVNGVLYFDYSSLPFCNRRDLFRDHYHMNYQGTKLFSPVLCGAFNNKINQQPLKGS